MKVFMAILMWIVRLTWGLPSTLIGFVIFLWSLHKHPKIGYIANTIVVELPHKHTEAGWGLSGGLFLFSNTESIWHREYLLYHEWGHSWPQQLAFGPLHPFIVGLPSVIRFWWRDHQYNKGRRDLPPYDSVWFEGTATKWGTSWFQYGAKHKWWE